MELSTARACDAVDDAREPHTATERMLSIYDIPDDVIVDLYLFYVPGLTMRSVCKSWNKCFEATRRTVRQKWRIKNLWWRYFKLPNGIIREVCEKIWRQKGHGKTSFDVPPRTLRTAKSTDIVRSSVTALWIDQRMIKSFGNLRAALTPFPDLKKIATDCASIAIDLFADTLERNTRVEKIRLHRINLDWKDLRTILELNCQAGLQFYTTALISCGLEVFSAKDKEIAAEHGYMWTEVDQVVYVYHCDIAPAFTTQVLVPETWTALCVPGRRTSRRYVLTMPETVPWDPLAHFCTNHALKTIQLIEIEDAQGALILKLAPNLSEVHFYNVRASSKVDDTFHAFSYTPRGLHAHMTIEANRVCKRLYNMIARGATNTMHLCFIGTAYGESIVSEIYETLLDLVVDTRACFMLEFYIYSIYNRVHVNEKLWKYLCTMPTLYSLRLQSRRVFVANDQAHNLIMERKMMRENGADILTLLRINDDIDTEARLMIGRQLQI